MDKTCEICRKTAKYKCPKCYIYYCSVSCCKQHKKQNCAEKIVHNGNQNDEKTEENKKDMITNSGVPKDSLQSLESDEEVNKLLANKHLRDLLLVIDKAENAEKIMEEAMQEPIFVEFADACLRIVDPQSDDDS